MILPYSLVEQFIQCYNCLDGKENPMVSYQQIYMFIGLNIGIMAFLFLIGAIWKKFARYRMLPIMICWLVFSWYYELRLSNQLPRNMSDQHYFLNMFLTIFYGFGVWLSAVGTLGFSVVLIHELVNPEKGSERRNTNGANHSPWPLWLICLAAGLFSTMMLKQSWIPQLNQMQTWLTRLVYVKLLNSTPQFPSCYIPVAGIAAGTLVSACFSGLYRRSKISFIWLISAVLVPVVTALLAPLLDFAGTVLVLVLAFAAYFNRETYYYPSRRPGWMFILIALVVGLLSGFYFCYNGVVVYQNSKVFTIVGGIAAGITIAALGYKSFGSEASPFRSLYSLAFIPFCTVGFSSAIAYILCLIAAAIILIFSLSASNKPSAYLRSPDLGPVNEYSDGSIFFVDNGKLIHALKDSRYPDGRYYTTDGEEYQVGLGGHLYKVR